MIPNLKYKNIVQVELCKTELQLDLCIQQKLHKCSLGIFHDNCGHAKMFQNNLCISAMIVRCGENHLREVVI